MYDCMSCVIVVFVLNGSTICLILFYISFMLIFSFFFFFKQKTAYEIDCDWSSDVCSSDLDRRAQGIPPLRPDANSTVTSLATCTFGQAIFMAQVREYWRAEQ